MQATGLISKLKVVYYAKETRWAGLTVQLPLNEVHPVRDLVLDRVYVVQEVDLPLLMLPAVIGRLPRTSSALFSSLSLGPRAADWSLETFRGTVRTGLSKRPVAGVTQTSQLKMTRFPICN